MTGVDRVGLMNQVAHGAELSPWDHLVILGFVMGLFALYLLAAGIAIRSLRRRFSRSPLPPSAMDRPWLKRPVLGLALLGLACMAYGRFVEPFRIEVTHLRIASSKLPAGSAPLRILHVTDTHCDGWGPNEERLLEIVREERPDLVVFTGDACNNRGDGYLAFRRLADEIQAPAGCYGVRGNWDVWFWADLRLFQDTHWRELNGTEELRIRGIAVRVCGVPFGGDPRRALPEASPEALTIFLFHTPDLVREPLLQRADLYLAGHTHGGQVCLPFYGALVTMSRYGKAYEAGLYRVGRCLLYVCRGLGMEGGPVPRVRFFCRPEVALIEVAPEG